MSVEVEKESEVGKLVREVVESHAEATHILPEGTKLYRCQPSRYDENPINYRANSDTRYADPDQKVGVYYLGLSKTVAVAESYQSGQGVDTQAVKLSTLEQSSLHELVTVRPLTLIDVGPLANRAKHLKLRHLVDAKGQGREGYKETRELAKACMELGEDVDGVLYPSAVYTKSGSMASCNVVLFDGRMPQVESVSFEAVLTAKLETDELASEFLAASGVVIE